MTYSELCSKFEECRIIWETELKASSYEELEDTWDHYSEQYRKGMSYMTEFLSIQVYDGSIEILETHKMIWEEKLFYILTQEEKLLLVKNRIEELKIYFIEHPSRRLIPAFYFDYLLNPRFTHFIFNDLPEESKNRIIDATKSDNSQIEICELVSKVTGDFTSLQGSIIEFMYLKVLFDELNSPKEKIPETLSNSIGLGKNKYPEIFISYYALKLFNYNVKVLTKVDKIGPALLTKLFKYFQDEKQIMQKVKPATYKSFLKNEHALILKKFDERTAPNDHDIEIFENIEKNFKFEFNTTN